MGLQTGVTEFFWTADTHWWHCNSRGGIVAMSNRPFSSVEEMDEALIENWNNVVRRGDVVYHLGDFAITWNKKCTEKIEKLANRLNGSIHLIEGNHDRRAAKRALCWASIQSYKEVKIQGQKIILFHYPILSWNQIHRGSWMCHGHSHHNLTYPFQAKILDVGVDGWNYTPVNFETLKEEMDKFPIPIVDHHK